MLIDLYIKNYAIIDEVTLKFDQHLNVLTGETGAGKSIILGALSLILGARMDSTALINKSEKCIIEARFNIKELQKIKPLFQEYDLDYDDLTIIRREINTNNKSRAFINDTPVNLSTLQSITQHLVDLHGQFDTSNIKDQDFIYEVIDALGRHELLFKSYQEVYYNRQTVQQSMQKLEAEIAQAQQDLDYHQFLLDELEEIDLKEGEEEEIESQLKLLEKSEEMLQLNHSINEIFNNDDMGLLQTLRKAQEEFRRLSNINPEYEELEHRLESAYIEIDDIANEVSKPNTIDQLDPESIEIMQARQSALFHLFKKHQVNSSQELLEIQNALNEKIGLSTSAEETFKQLQKEWKVLDEKAHNLADELSQSRRKTIQTFEPEVNKIIHLIGMPNALLKVEKSENKTLNKWGKDQLQFVWDANKSGKFHSLDKVASGGELSRIMLCIKTMTAQAMELPTLIFDEVDTGISGEAARQVSILLANLSQQHQIVCITHLSQVASKGKHHFYVYKQEEEGKVHTHIKVLSREERIEHISEMISGGEISDAIRSHVAEQIEH